MLSSTSVPLPHQASSWSSELLPGLLAVGVIGLLIVVYLSLDWLNTRRETRRLARRRQLARDAWKQEQSQLP